MSINLDDSEKCINVRCSKSINLTAIPPVDDKNFHKILEAGFFGD